MAARALNLLLPSTCKNLLVRDTAFLRLWTGTTASGLATWALPFLLALAVLDGSLDATGLGLALAARTVGFLAAVPAAGVLADRYPRRTVVAWSAAAAAAASPVAAAGLGTSTLVLAVAAAVVGAGQGACRPAFQALTAEVVAPERRQQANAAMTIAVRVSVLVAPSVAALLALAVDVHTLVAGTGALWLVAAMLPPRAPSPHRSPGARSCASSPTASPRPGATPGSSRVSPHSPR